jgi:hypothetical protein
MKSKLDTNRRTLMSASLPALAYCLLPPVVSAKTVPTEVPHASKSASILKPGSSFEKISARLKDTATRHHTAIKEWAELWPDEYKKALEGAEQSLLGFQIIDGTGGKPGFIGNPVAWTTNPTTSPEYIALLNRMNHWRGLLTAWSLTGKGAYADKVATELDSWITTCPTPELDEYNEPFWRSYGPWRALEVGIRMNDAWPFALTMLAGTEFMPFDRLSRVLKVMHDHGRILSEITPRLWPNANHNHYTFEMIGLLNLSSTVPEFSQAAMWQKQAWHDLERNAIATITDEGGQIEGAPYYHNIVVSIFSLGILIGTQSGLVLSDTFKNRLSAAGEYSLQSCRPNGTNVPWADSDSSFGAIDAAIACSVCIDDWRAIQTMKSFIDPARIREAAGRISSHGRSHPSPVTFPKAWLETYKTLPATSGQKSYWAKKLDQTMMRTDWSDKASSVFFGCQTGIENGHAHMDPGSIDYCALGRPIIVDPGRYTYTEGAERRLFKSVKFHNTLSVNDKEPFEYIETFKSGPQREGRIISHYSSANYEAYEAINRNYYPAVHHRLVVLMNDGVLVVADAITNLRKQDTVQIWYHFDTTSLTWDAKRSQAETLDAQMPNVLLNASGGLRGKVLDGYVSDSMDVRRASRRLRLESSKGDTDRGFVSLVTPFTSRPTTKAATLKKTAFGSWNLSLGLTGVSELLWTPQTSLVQV